MDTLMRGLVADGAVRVLAVDATVAARRTAEIHQLDAQATQVAGECLVATLLMSAHIGVEERITLQVQAQSPRFSFVSDVEGSGTVRARLRPQALAGTARGHIDGVLVAIKSSPTKELYRGSTAISQQSVVGALRGHLTDSGQLPCILDLDVKMEDDEVLFAGGYLVEPLPYARDQPSIDAETFQDRFGQLRDPWQVVIEARAAEFDGDRMRILEDRSLSWSCTCSRARVHAMLGGLAQPDLVAMIEEDDGAEVTCHFCGSAYRFSADALRVLLEAKHPQG